MTGCSSQHHQWPLSGLEPMTPLDHGCSKLAWPYKNLETNSVNQMKTYFSTFIFWHFTVQFDYNKELYSIKSV